jgi:hypothetical protein
MRYGRTAAVFMAAAIAGSSAPAQTPVHNDTGTTTETQERQADGNSDLMWNLLGMFGLVGLTGLWRRSDNDGYTDDPI